jgi:hypothetical protein
LKNTAGCRGKGNGHAQNGSKGEKEGHFPKGFSFFQSFLFFFFAFFSFFAPLRETLLLFLCAFA